MTEIFEDIRQFYHFHFPKGELGKYIEFFSESAVDLTQDLLKNEPFSVRMFPSWSPTCYINLGEPYHLLDRGEVYTVREDEDVLVLRDSMVERFNSPLDHIVTIKFRPGGTEALLNEPITNLNNHALALSTLLPKRLIQSVKKAESFSQRVVLLEAFFSNRLPGNPGFRVQYMQEAITAYQASGYALNNSALADILCLTPKTLNRYFIQVAGVAPKIFLGNLRARMALADYIQTRRGFVAAKYGYFDSSHFYKEVLTLTGQRLSVFY